MFCATVSCNQTLQLAGEVTFLQQLPWITEQRHFGGSEPNVLCVCFGPSACTAFRTAADGVMTALVSPAGRPHRAGGLPAFAAAGVWPQTPQHSGLIHSLRGGLDPGWPLAQPPRAGSELSPDCNVAAPELTTCSYRSWTSSTSHPSDVTCWSCWTLSDWMNQRHILKPTLNVSWFLCNRACEPYNRSMIQVQTNILALPDTPGVFEHDESSQESLWLTVQLSQSVHEKRNSFYLVTSDICNFSSDMCLVRSDVWLYIYDPESAGFSDECRSEAAVKCLSEWEAFKPDRAGCYKSLPVPAYTHTRPIPASLNRIFPERRSDHPSEDQTNRKWHLAAGGVKLASVVLSGLHHQEFPPPSVSLSDTTTLLRRRAKRRIKVGVYYIKYTRRAHTAEESQRHNKSWVFMEKCWLRVETLSG